ncbi:MAG: hypothetical protein P8O79_00725 [Halieaceae bacterium]|nr:hypothetical protein [Halieaceae bacterium]
MYKKTFVAAALASSLSGCVIAAKTTTTAGPAADSLEECVSQCAAQFDGHAMEVGEHRVFVKRLGGDAIEKEVEVFLNDGQAPGEGMVRIETRGPNGAVDRWVGSVEDMPEGEDIDIEMLIDAQELPYAPKGVKVIKLGDKNGVFMPHMAPMPHPGRSSLAQELRDLGEAKREGLITDEEFSELRTAVLNKYKSKPAK